MPRLADPPRGFAVTANNRPAPDDFPYPLGGVWVSGFRARRIREMIEGKERVSFADLSPMQLDVLSLRAVECVPRLLAALGNGESSASRAAIGELRRWDCLMKPESPAAAIFDIFFAHWSHAVANERFHGDAATLVAAAAGGLASELLSSDAAGWFAEGRRLPALREAFAAALDTLSSRLGPRVEDWQWGKLHRTQVRHVLSHRGELSALLDQPEHAVGGNGLTVCNTGGDSDWRANVGAGYRMLVDMSVRPAEMWAIDAGSESGQAGSPHYGDQLTQWLAGRYHRLPLDRARMEELARHRLVLRPKRPA